MGAQKYPKVAGYELLEQIGGGGFSVVFRAVNIEDHRAAACKVVALSDETPDKDRKVIDKEMRVHTALKHRNVLEFLNAIIVETKYKHQYYPGYYMLLEFAAGGDLFDKIAPDVGVGEDVAKLYFSQLVDGMSYIHAQGVCHRDLKPENLLLDAAGTLKISDFGLAAVFKLKDSGKERALTERCGSLPYVAPELNSEGAYQAEPIDAWGVGVILFTLLAGNTPWDEPTQNSPEYCRYLTGAIFNEEPWNKIGCVALSLIKSLLCVDPRIRMRLDQIHSHAWLMTPTQLARLGPAALADALTENLRQNGDLSYMNPSESDITTDDDGDDMMKTAPLQSQFTQSLLLFSQTQSGRRYTPTLTRFYASIPPAELMLVIHSSLISLGVTCKFPGQPDTAAKESSVRLRVGGFDTKKLMFKGWVEVENFTYRGHRGSFCVMQRDVGNPLCWRQLWKALITSAQVSPYVLRK